MNDEISLINNIEEDLIEKEELGGLGDYGQSFWSLID